MATVIEEEEANQAADEDMARKRRRSGSSEPKEKKQNQQQSDRGRSVPLKVESDTGGREQMPDHQRGVLVLWTGRTHGVPVPQQEEHGWT